MLSLSLAFVGFDPIRRYHAECLASTLLHLSILCRPHQVYITVAIFATLVMTKP